MSSHDTDPSDARTGSASTGSTSTGSTSTGSASTSAESPITPQVEGLWVKRARRGPMDARSELEFEQGRGIVGNADQGGRRQVTIIAAEVFEALRDELTTDVDPAMRRANVLVRGLELRQSRGRRLGIGPVELRIGGETRPCERMDETLPGLTRSLDPDWRGGVYAQVETSGRVRIGDPVRWLDDDA
jgi:MOSC domain-containing protein YiiM